MPVRHGFPRNERLKSRKHIDGLFATGKSYQAFPVRMAYRIFAAGAEVEKNAPLRAGVSAPKRHFKRAVDRNRIKRLLREAYRLQKAAVLELLQQKGLAGHVFFLYGGKELPDFKIIEAAVGKCLRQLLRQLHETNS